MNSDICMLDICMFRRYEAAFQLGDQQNALNLDILISDRFWAVGLSFSIYCQTLFRELSAGVLCTLKVAG